MADVKFTVVFDETWPFRIRIMDGDREVASFNRYIMCSSWKTLEDVREARDWDGMTGAPTVEDARELIARQEREVIMFAASPDLYEALKGLLDHYAMLVESGDAGNWDAEREPQVIAARTALAKAEGQS